MSRVVVAPDSFKGSLSAKAAAEAMARGIARARPGCDIVVVPMADGGEGTLDVLAGALGGNRRTVPAHGPLGDPVDAAVALVRRATTAVVEMAAVSGFALAPVERRDPLVTTTYGLGEVIRAAIDSGVEEVILAVGGSATVDGGAGMMQALGLSLLDDKGCVIAAGIGGGKLASIRRFEWKSPPERLDEVQFTIACDVLNPACGPSGAARVFGPQKGADAAGVELLEAGLSHWADLLESVCGRPIRNEPGAGAAGGVALPLLALCQATLVPGIDLVSEAVGLAAKIAEADLVITGEGRLDRQSKMGKVVGGVGRLCRGADVPCVAIVGAAGEGADECLAVIDRYYTLDAPMERTESRLEEVAGLVAREWL